MTAETIGDLPPIYLLAYVVFGVFLVLAIYHVIAKEVLERPGERAFSWIALAVVWGSSAILTISSLT